MSGGPFIDSLWTSTGKECMATDGACWSVIPANFRFILFGFYPYDEQWRPAIAIALLVGLLIYSQYRRNWKKNLLYIWIGALVVMGALMKGGLLGLVPVETTQWGGLPLTLMLSVFGLTAAYPLGIVLALGRQSRLPAIRSLCVIYIELIRGVPLISLLFYVLGGFSPVSARRGQPQCHSAGPGRHHHVYGGLYRRSGGGAACRAWRAGQYEAAESLGLNYMQTMRLVILPQALKIVIPPSVSILISAFKDTSLVVIIALYDLLKTTQSHPGRSPLDGLCAGSLYLRGHDLFCVLLLHVPFQPQAGAGAGYGLVRNIEGCHCWGEQTEKYCTTKITKNTKESLTSI